MACVLFGNTTWTNRLFYDDFASQNWREQFYVFNDTSTIDEDGKSLRLPGVSVLSTKTDSISYGIFSVRVGNIDTIDTTLYFSHNTSRGIDINLRNRTFIGSVRPGIQYTTLVLPKNDNAYRVDVLPDSVGYYIDDVATSVSSTTLNTNPGMRVILYNRKNSIPLIIRSLEFYYNSTDTQDCAPVNQEESWRKYTSSIVAASVFGGLIVSGGIAYALRKSRNHNGAGTTLDPAQMPPSAEFPKDERPSIDVYGGDPDIDAITEHNISNRNATTAFNC
jgi:hypothetical protein